MTQPIYVQYSTVPIDVAKKISLSFWEFIINKVRLVGLGYIKIEKAPPPLDLAFACQYKTIFVCVL